MTKQSLTHGLYAPLYTLAKKASSASYAPYSRFHVGAAILTADGQLFTGCNIENASYGASICAERTAFVKAISKGGRSFAAIAVYGESENDGFYPLCFPCGICRQFMSEFCPPAFPVVLCDVESLCVYTLGELLPNSFRL